MLDIQVTAWRFSFDVARFCCPELGVPCARSSFSPQAQPVPVTVCSTVVPQRLSGPSLRHLDDSLPVFPPVARRSLPLSFAARDAAPRGMGWSVAGDQCQPWETLEKAAKGHCLLHYCTCTCPRAQFPIVNPCSLPRLPRALSQTKPADSGRCWNAHLARICSVPAGCFGAISNLS